MTKAHRRTTGGLAMLTTSLLYDEDVGRPNQLTAIAFSL
jgi:hypothetical protein